MKEITIILPDELYAKIKDQMAIRKMCGNDGSISDQLTLVIIGNIEKGKSVLDLTEGDGE